MRRSISRSGQASVVSAPTLLQVSKEEVAANSASARKMVGRTAEALNKLRESAKKEGYEVGYQAGFEAGRKEGLDAIEAEYRASIQEFAHLLQDKADQVVFAAQQWTFAAEQDLAELAVLIAARIVAREIRLDTEVVNAIAHEAVAEFAHSTSIRIRMNPFDLPALQARRDELLAVSRQLRQIEIVGDEAVAGGCIVESDGGVVDATLETRLKCVLDSIREAA